MKTKQASDMANLKNRGILPFFSTLALVQGAYFLITGIWPIIHINSFMAVTGPKTDLWLVKTVGVLVGVIGLGLIASWMIQRITFPLVLHAAGSALGLCFINVIYVWKGVISPIYLLDSVVEIIFVISWCAFIWQTGLFTRYTEKRYSK